VITSLILSLLLQICEDCGRELNSGEIGRPVNILIPKLLQFFHSSHESHRIYALECINEIVFYSPTIIIANMKEIVQVRSLIPLNLNRFFVPALMFYPSYRPLCPYVNSMFQLNRTSEFVFLGE
jgi:hypothetical protein